MKYNSAVNNKGSKVIEIWQAFLLTFIFVGLIEIIDSLSILSIFFIEIIPYAWSLSVILLLSKIILFLCVYFFLNRINKLPKKNEIGYFHLGTYIYVIVLGIGFVFLQLIFYSLMFSKPLTEYLGGEIRSSDWPAIIGFVLIVPIIEELFFRAFLMRELAVKYSQRIGLILSSILFSLAHVPNIEQMFVTLLGGIIAGVIYLKNNSIIYPIVFHGSWNLTIHVLIKLI